MVPPIPGASGTVWGTTVALLKSLIVPTWPTGPSCALGSAGCCKEGLLAGCPPSVKKMPGAEYDEANDLSTMTSAWMLNGNHPNIN